MPEPVVVVVVRHPDFANDIDVFGVAGEDLTVVNLDLGRSDLSKPDEYAEWRESHMLDARLAREKGRDDAADLIEQVIADNHPDAT